LTSIGLESVGHKQARAHRVARYTPTPRRPHLVGPEGARRALNVAVAAIGLVLAFPLMVLIALAIRLTSRGPVLYTQTRVGLDRRGGGRPIDISRRRADIGGRPFTIYKFRTMATRPPHAEGAEVWAKPDDPRVTAIGRVLRKYRLDELPQLWNVLRGDMNIVGPRPEQPSIFVDLRRHIEGYAQRQAVRPGITGWAQVNHRYDQCLDDVRKKVSLDLEYISRQSFTEDLKIMALTVPVMVFRKGAW
jgi:lipopolysaccharide/colanic/teichoic acid biosynthesis glycosyltransferase